MHQSILNLLDKEYELYYVNYDDDLYENLDILQRCLLEGSPEPLDDKVWEWFLDDDYGMNYALEELAKSISDQFDVDLERAKEFIECHSDELRYEIEGRDTSDPEKDLLRHTRQLSIFYETGIELYGMTWGATEEEQNDSRKALKRVLGIKIRDKTWDKHISRLFADAYYGGKLVIYFLADADELMDIVNSNYNQITFKDPMVAIIDNSGGSGNHEEFTGLTIKLPFAPQMLFVDETVHYSYTREVCGLVGDWCSCTEWQLSKTKKKVNIEPGSTAEYMKEEARKDKVFKEGGCTPGDMDMRRHRDTYYLNEFPCGTHCPHCHTFWID